MDVHTIHDFRVLREKKIMFRLAKIYDKINKYKTFRS
jgi:hypothetical protein